MRVIRHIEGASVRFRRPVVTLGNFDGVHLGHREILRRVVGEARARDGEAVVITFFPHPTAVLAPDRAPPPIASLRERLASFREAGIDVVVARHFTKAFSRLSPQEFVDRYLVGAVGAVKVIIGHSVSFGRGRAGGAETLREAGGRAGFAVEVVGPVRVDGIDVSSTAVREHVGKGDMPLARRLLGRPYGIGGRVISGDRRGKALGFPTANIRPRVPVLAPDGVYAVRVEHEGRRIPGIANIGRNPTFGEGRPRGVEAHLFEFEGELYGRWIRVLLVERIREERRFPSADALVEQIRRDVERARSVLNET
ncbi:MAG: bifunctional riboflavin kinase/FAD synthetase [Candidatus Binatia bacterium]